MQKQYHTKCKKDILVYTELNKEKRFSVAQLHSYLKSIGRNANITTIYRNLDRMTESGELLKFKDTKDDCYVYQYHEPDIDCYEHLHIQCSDCGRIVHLNHEFMKELSDYLSGTYGFDLICKESVMIGLCDKCKK